MNPRRTLCCVFGVATRTTSASPSPVAGETCNQPLSVAAVHEHSRAADTETLVRPPSEGKAEGDATAVVQRAMVGPESSVRPLPLQPQVRSRGEMRATVLPVKAGSHLLSRS